MKMSRRARRMERHHKRGKAGSLNLVSLMDIFTILVFFLLVSSSESESIPSKKVLVLPDSIAKQKPKETLTIIVNEKNLVIQGRRVGTVDDILMSESDTIETLKNELDHHAGRAAGATGLNEFIGEITIMGDRNIPYKLLKKIMITCTQANYTNISLAVMQKTVKKG